MAARTTTMMAVAGAVVLVGAATAAVAPRPNVIFILADDLGYADDEVSSLVLPNTSTRIPTPQLERMAAGGMKFVRGYSGQVCAPSRTTLMTGRDLGHTTIRGNDGAYSPLLKTDVTVAAVLKKAGYKTGIVGKWGLGNFGTSGYPLNQGFDYFVGQDTQVGCHDWYPTQVCSNEVDNFTVNTAADLDYTKCLGSNASCTWANDLDKQKGLEFIADSAGSVPFFLYLSTTTPHAGFLKGSGPKPSFFNSDFPVPYPYNQQYLNHTEKVWTIQQKMFASAVWAQDVMVGAVLDKLVELNVAKNTLVFFSGDNGPDSHDLTLFDDPGIFRGKKRSLHEGGIRQTILAYWPGTISPGSKSDAVFAFWDVLPTVAELAGVSPSEMPEIEGVSAADVLAGAPPPPPGSRFLYYEFCDYSAVDGLLPQMYKGGWVQAVRWDDNATTTRTEWKGIITDSDQSSLLLYNLTADPSESIPFLLNGSNVPPAVARARDIILTIMVESHVENEFWPSSKNSSQKCCVSCFNPQGCAAPCKKITPDHSPVTSSSPVPVSELSGLWHAIDESGPVTFELAVAPGGFNINITNKESQASCWSHGSGTVSPDGLRVQVYAAGEADCIVEAEGIIDIKGREKTVINNYYPYNVDSLSLSWTVTKNGHSASWPSWSRTAGPYLVQHS